jgi:hypothetical protein
MTHHRSSVPVEKALLAMATLSLIASLAGCVVPLRPALKPAPPETINLPLIQG